MPTPAGQASAHKICSAKANLGWLDMLAQCGGTTPRLDAYYNCMATYGFNRGGGRSTRKNRKARGRKTRHRR